MNEATTTICGLVGVANDRECVLIGDWDAEAIE